LKVSSKVATFLSKFPTNLKSYEFLNGYNDFSRTIANNTSASSRSNSCSILGRGSSHGSKPTLHWHTYNRKEYRLQPYR
jgi:hypothetical protein